MIAEEVVVVAEEMKKYSKKQSTLLEALKLLLLENQPTLPTFTYSYNFR